jgi:hypothetical protein
MVDTSLNKKYTAKESVAMDYSPIPDGLYRAKVKEVSPWKKETKTIKVIQRDENGNALKDEKGNNITETVQNCEFYNCSVRMEITEGQYSGRLVFHNLSTHPNMPFSIPAFLYGLGVSELAAGEIQDNVPGKECMIDVITETYTKNVQNKETGLDEEQERQINKVKNFKQLPDQDIEMNDLGI